MFDGTSYNFYTDSVKNYTRNRGKPVLQEIFSLIRQIVHKLIMITPSFEPSSFRSLLFSRMWVRIFRRQITHTTPASRTRGQGIPDVNKVEPNFFSELI